MSSSIHYKQLTHHLQMEWLLQFLHLLFLGSLLICSSSSRAISDQIAKVHITHTFPMSLCLIIFYDKITKASLILCSLMLFIWEIHHQTTLMI